MVNSRDTSFLEVSSNNPTSIGKRAALYTPVRTSLVGAHWMVSFFSQTDSRFLFRADPEEIRKIHVLLRGNVC